MSGIHILIPMSGSGQRFRDAGYDTPKPFIDVNGAPMISRVLHNLACAAAHTTLIARRDDHKFLAELGKHHRFDTVYIDQLTEGAACTALIAKDVINNDEPLLIANSDQLIDINLQDFVDSCKRRALDGLIMTFAEPTRNPTWSYIRLDDGGLILETKEKFAISDQATVGLYLFAKGRYFVEAASEMMAKNDRTLGEFYLCPTYNYMIQKGYKVGAYPIDPASMHGLGTPEDLARYLTLMRR